MKEPPVNNEILLTLMDDGDEYVTSNISSSPCSIFFDRLVNTIGII